MYLELSIKSIDKCLTVSFLIYFLVVLLISVTERDVLEFTGFVHFLILVVVELLSFLIETSIMKIPF